MNNILVIDDEENLCKSLKRSLQPHGYSVSWTSASAEASRLFERERPDAVLLDLKMPEPGGIEVLTRLKEIDPSVPVIMMTAYGTVREAVEAMKMGALDYLLKPFDEDELVLVLGKAIEMSRLGREVSHLRAKLSTSLDLGARMGTSRAIQEVIRQARAVAMTDTTVLLQGETGTGKELLAQAIHHWSDRREAPFVPIDCAALPETLVESELFGHEKGAFTGAGSAARGKVERANGGSLFLDEIGELPPPSQAKLLRFIETRKFTRLGEAAERGVDSRIIAATNAPLDLKVGDKSFRADLFYRLNEFPIHIPPLRSRPDDVPIIARALLSDLTNGTWKDGAISPAVMGRLQEHAWPGNVRELRNALKRALVTAKDRIEERDMPEGVLSHVKAAVVTTRTDVVHSRDSDLKSIGEHARIDAERQAIKNALRESNGHKGKAALTLGIDPKTLYQKIKRLGISD